RHRLGRIRVPITAELDHERRNRTRTQQPDGYLHRWWQRLKEPLDIPAVVADRDRSQPTLTIQPLSEHRQHIIVRTRNNTIGTLCRNHLFLLWWTNKDHQIPTLGCPPPGLCRAHRTRTRR